MVVIRKGHIGLLHYLMEKKEDYVYNIAKTLRVSVGNTHNYLAELQELELLTSSLVVYKGSRRTVRLYKLPEENIEKVKKVIEDYGRGRK